MDTFEVAVLRILIKRQRPMKLHTLVSGFPDDCEDAVFSAISNLKTHEYVILSDYNLSGYVSVNRQRRKEILRIVRCDTISEPTYVGTQEIRKEFVNAKDERFKKTYLLSPRVTCIIIASLLVVGLFSAMGFSLPSTSTEDAEMIAYMHHGYVHWSAFGVNNEEGGNNVQSVIPHTLYIPVKDCKDAPVNTFLSS
jgi:hypothetical protein